MVDLLRHRHSVWLGLVIALCTAPAGARTVQSDALLSGSLPPTARFELGFSPGGSAEAVVLRAIGGARESILVAAYSFTSRTIAKALVNAQHRGVKVFVLADSRQNSKAYSAVQYLANQGVAVRVIDRFDAFHHKFLVLDQRHVELGSFNYSAAATRNAENAMLLWGVPEIAERYTAEWRTLWDQGVPVQAAY
ncbi:phospholipase D family protein (plasmid) [Burkholderia aenigmatica]|uniref:phospholipase D family nuclease n=1 Tax=Burkholderia aenigmatica TaxID=2015348 RepID=UPI003B4376BA